jgi:hypothetical protein
VADSPGTASRDRIGALGVVGRTTVDVDYCWARAAEFTRRAEETTDAETRKFFYCVRDSWIRTANHQEILSGAGVLSEPLETIAPPLSAA